MYRLLNLVLICCLLGSSIAEAQADKPAGDAASLYLQAAKIVNDNAADQIMSPGNSNFEYPGYPPYGLEWMRAEKAAFAFNVKARNLAHQARSVDNAKWPAMTGPNQQLYLNDCRSLSNDLADAAILQALEGDPAAAIEIIRDQLHLADSLKKQPEVEVIVVLIGDGLRALAMQRLNVITSGIVLTKDPQDSKSVQITVARDLVKQLLDHPDVEAEMLDAEKHDDPMGEDSVGRKKSIEINRRGLAECDMAAMSLACHLYRFDTGKWPDSLADLHAYIPTVPIDPWGDGKQTLGYALIKKGLPDGSDRPLVYCRSQMKDGLFFRVDEPEYAFYDQDGSKLPAREQKHGGQFRDVARWAPPAGFNPSPTTQALK